MEYFELQLKIFSNQRLQVGLKNIKLTWWYPVAFDIADLGKTKIFKIRNKYLVQTQTSVSSSFSPHWHQSLLDDQVLQLYSW